MKECNSKHGELKKDNRTAIGIVLLIIGMVLLGKNLHFIPGNIARILFTWQMLIIAIGIIQIVAKGKTVSGLFMIGVGGVFLWDKILPFSPFEWQIAWPLMFVFVGAMLVVSYLGKSVKEISQSKPQNEQTKKHKPKTRKRKFSDVEFDIDKIEPIED